LSLNFCDGPSGTFKTATIIQLIHCFKTGEPFFGLPVTKRRVGYIMLDRPFAPTYRDLFTLFDLTAPADYHYYALLDDSTYDPRKCVADANAFQQVWDYLKRLAPEPGEVVIIDTAIPDLVYGHNEKDPYNAVLTCNWWRRLIASFQITLIAVAGGNKLKLGEGYQNARHAIPGSQVFSLKADTIINTAREAATDAVVLQILPRALDVPPWERRIIWDPKGQRLQIFEESNAGLAELSTADALCSLIPEEGEGALSRHELDALAEQHSVCSRATVGRYLKRLKDAGRINWEDRGPISRRKIH